MRRCLMLLVLIHLFAHQARTQSTDSTLRKYLICTDKEYSNYSIILKEGKTLIIKEFDGIRRRGHLIICNDSTLSIFNKSNQRKDTFLLKNIKKIRVPSVGRGIACGGLFVIGSAFCFAGINSEPHGFLRGAGISIGMVINSLGLALFNGPSYRNWLYNFRIMTTSGHELRRKDLKK